MVMKAPDRLATLEMIGILLAIVAVALTVAVATGCRMSLLEVEPWLPNATVAADGSVSHISPPPNLDWSDWKQWGAYGGISLLLMAGGVYNRWDRRRFHGKG